MKLDLPFTKAVGAGNDFVVVDGIHNALDRCQRRWPEISKKICDRHTGVGSDGLLVLAPSKKADVRMRIFNPDGSEADMCGNGARCAARIVHDWKRRSGRHVSIETIGGLITAFVRRQRIRMSMPEPYNIDFEVVLKTDGGIWQGTYINTGVPHFVVPVRAFEGLDVDRLGSELRRHKRFSPQGANVDFVEQISRPKGGLRVRTYERGVERETLACGTGVAASAIACELAVRRKSAGRLDARVRNRITECRRDVTVRSGDMMSVSFKLVAGGCAERVTDVMLEGSARRVFDGVMSLSDGGKK